MDPKEPKGRRERKENKGFRGRRERKENRGYRESRGFRGRKEHKDLAWGIAASSSSTKRMNREKQTIRMLRALLERYYWRAVTCYSTKQ